MLGILKWAGITCLGIYIFVAVVAWALFWKGGMFRDDVDGVFAEGWKSFKLAFSWPLWFPMAVWHMRKED